MKPAVLKSLLARPVDVMAALGLVPGYKPLEFESRSCPDDGQAESSNARMQIAVTAYLTPLGFN